VPDEWALQRIARYQHVAEQKRAEAIKSQDHESYFNTLLAVSAHRQDDVAVSDRRQVQRDLPRSWNGLPPLERSDTLNLEPILGRIMYAYIERGRTVCPKSRALGMCRPVASSTAGGWGLPATSAKGLLAGYPQGLNFMAGMCLMVAGARWWDGRSKKTLEETAFWLLAALLEDVLDPDFFGADVRGDQQMAYIGGLGMRSIILEHAEEYCPTLFSFMGGEAFASSLGNVLDQWVLSLFIGCAPHRLLEHLWDHLLLPSPYHPAESKMMMRGPAVAPRGLIMACSFSLAALCCCGEEHYAQSDVLRRVKEVRVSGACIEDITLEAGEIVMGIRSRLLQWEEKDDTHLLSTATRIIVELLGVDGSGGDRLWKECCVHKSRIMDYSGDIDNQFRALVQGTHFDISEIGRLREALRSMPKAGRSAEGCDRETFGQLVRDTVPDFPSHLCDRLFDKLDPFKVGHLTFVELVCGISALSLGSMDEKLQVCFDLFDSEGRHALTLKDMCELCTVLFRVALSQGLSGTSTASTDDDLLSRSSSMSSLGETPRLRKSSTFNQEDSCEITTKFLEPTKSEQQPWRSMLLRLLGVARVRTPGGLVTVAFQDFRNAANMEPALLYLFSWCLPRPPDVSHRLFDEDAVSVSSDSSFSSQVSNRHWPIERWNFVRRLCVAVGNWRSRELEDLTVQRCLQR